MATPEGTSIPTDLDFPAGSAYPSSPLKFTAIQAHGRDCTQGGTVMSKAATSAFESSVGVVMIRVPAGSFIMGSPESEDGHRVWERQRTITFVNDFYLGKTPVTQA